MSADDPLLSVRGLTKHYPITAGVLRREVGRVRAVDGVSFDLSPGETLGLVGESGCGKSTVATTMLRLEQPTAGAVWFDGEDVTALEGRALKRFRRRTQLVFQDPSSSFDPRMSVGESVAEPLVVHGLTDRARRRAIVRDLLQRVGLEADDADRYPHEFSGGQKQRIALARALVTNPDLVVADEPTSALDVSVQAEILALIERLQAAFGLSILFISHDMGVVREICDRVAVMYLGEIVELAPTETLFERPQHPYTRALLASIPNPDPRKRGLRASLTGDVPDPSDPPPGCRFHTRCPEVVPPPGVSLEQPVWRAILDLRVRLRAEGLDRESIRSLAARAPGGEADATPSAAAVREAFGLPDPLEDQAAESALAEALAHLVAGDDDAAAARLAEAFPTVCVERHPETLSVAPDREVACHLHDPGVDTPDPVDPTAAARGDPGGLEVDGAAPEARWAPRFPRPEDADEDATE